MRFLSIHLPFLPTDRIHRQEGRRNGSHELPLALWAKVDNAQVLTAVDPSAVAWNLRQGMTVAVARGMCPTLRLVEADPSADLALLAALTDWCRRFTPLAALDPPDGAILDVSGVAHLFGGDEGLLRTVEDVLAGQGFRRRVSLAPYPAAARAFARWKGPRLVRDDGSLRKAVGALPTGALQLTHKPATRMRDAGLRTLGDLMLRPRAPITARFGPAVFARIDAMLGICRDPLSPRFEAPPYMAERRYAEGLARHEDIVATLGMLCDELCAMLARHEEGARKILASFFRVDGAVRHLETATSRPSRDPRAMVRLLNERLGHVGENGLDTGYGFDVIRLAALTVEPLAAEQSALHGTLAGDGECEDSTDLIDRLGARLGTRRVLRFDFVDTHWPERAVFLRPAAQGPAGVPAFPSPRGAAVLLPTRPVKLFEKPEPIEALATVPDGPPEKFWWRRVMHDVVAFEGPERIASEWWRDVGPTRDYFRVEDADGGRFWLFREGIYGVEKNAPRWFMHGMFG